MPTSRGHGRDKPRFTVAWLLVQALEIPVSGFFLSKDKGPDAEPTKYTEASLKMRVGGPGEERYARLSRLCPAL